MGKRRRYARVLLIGLLAGGLGVARGAAVPQGLEPAAPAAGQADLLRPLQDLLSQLRTLRQDYYQQKAADDAELQQTRENRDLLRAQVADLQKQQADLDRQLAEVREQVQSLQVQRDQWKAVQEVVEHQISPLVAQERLALATTPPYRRQERLARLQTGAADMLGPLWSYAQEELRLAASSETYTERATGADGTQPYARYFRVGQMILGYVTEDGRQAAIWLPSTEGGQWQTLDDPKRIASLRHAIEILDRQQAPRFVPLPIAPRSATPAPMESQ